MNQIPLRSRSREEQTAYHREWINNHRDSSREYQRRYLRKRGLLIRAILDAELARGCIDCGENDFRVLEFDHARGKKLFALGSCRRGTSISAVYAEIDKCEVRCANCHALITRERQRTV